MQGKGLITIHQVQIFNAKVWGSLLCFLTAFLFFVFPVFAAPNNSAMPTELTLDQAVNMALANNPSGKIAVFDYEAAKGALTAARSYRWPTISGTHKDSWTWSGEKYNQESGLDPNYVAGQYTNAITASWVLWSGNKVESQVSQAKLSLDSNKWGVAAARQLLKYNATDAYFKFMAARDAVKLSQESVGRLERYLQDVKLQFDVGVVAKVESCVRKYPWPSQTNVLRCRCL